jgi:DNA-binding beta-propeller fold protein YncE
MYQSKVFFILIIIFCLNSCQAQTPVTNSELHFISAIQLPNVSGRIDHLAFDNTNQTIFVAALGNNTVEIVDLKARKVIHTLKSMNEPQGIAYVSDSKTVFVANGGNGECNVFKTGTYQKINTIKLSDDADNVRYDSIDNRIYVGYSSGAIAIIDANTYKTIADIKLDGHPESFQLDKTAKKIYVNVPDAQQIEVIDLTNQLVTDKWKLTEAKSNFPMSLDETNHRLFIGCRHPAKLLIIDTQTGKTITSFDTDSDVDDVFYNNTAKQIYMSCGAGYVDVFKQISSDKYDRISKIGTRPGARTSLFIPLLNQLIIAAPSYVSNEAQLMFYQIK